MLKKYRFGFGLLGLVLFLVTCLLFNRRRNILALIPAVGFTVCHLIYASVNFII